MMRQIEGYARYYITSDGRVLSKNKDGRLKERKPEINHNGYKRVNLLKDGKYKKYFVHRLVAMAFIGEIPEGYQVNHIDSNRLNNDVNNLEIVTVSENSRHSIDYGNRDFNYLCKRVRGIHIDTGNVVEFDSLTDACKELGLCHGNITKVINGERRHTGGYVWTYVGGSE